MEPKNANMDNKRSFTASRLGACGREEKIGGGWKQGSRFRVGGVWGKRIGVAPGDLEFRAALFCPNMAAFRLS